MTLLERKQAATPTICRTRRTTVLCLVFAVMLKFGLHDGSLSARIRDVCSDPELSHLSSLNNLAAADNMDPGGVDYARFTSDHRIYRSFFLAGFSVLAYDHLLTLHTEVKYIWKSKLRPSTLWYLLLRYTCLASNIWVSTFYFLIIDYESCVKMEILWEVLVILQEALIELTLIVRVYAMYGRNPWILAALAFVLLLVAIPLWASITNGHPQIFTAPGPGLGVPGCHNVTPRTDTRPIGLYVRVNTNRKPPSTHMFHTNRDCRRLGSNAYTQRRSSSALMYTSTSLVERMWRDGVMYFGLIGLVNTANLFTFYFGDILLAGFLSWFATSLSITLLSRLILNLHEASMIGIDTEEPNTVNLETLKFRTVTRADNSMN
ncbi:hypothetical protein GGX14DRAFT_407091 [Mycena pura]|uniref:DUF6533 domain-containing protein n=1 Tax=Mycena pura TaxID=153505 RepID=A0AAD6XZ52_9AGAR|nr:hypothetical protein GGX14DRAFT_407091 [Mycena pura]